jgi:hypothetical protein
MSSDPICSSTGWCGPHSDTEKDKKKPPVQYTHAPVEEEYKTTIPQLIADQERRIGARLEVPEE